MAAWDAPPYPIRAAGAAIPAFVGRAAETSAAEEAWASVRAGGRQVIFIGGEPGAGKSRLAAEIASAVYGQGAVVLLGTCSPEPGVPYQPFAECLEQLLGGTRSGALADCLPDSAAELLRLTPLVWRHRPELVAPAGDGGDYRRELFDAIAALLHAVGEERPVVCVLEDLHWAGQPTLQLLDHVAQRSAGPRRGCWCCARTARPRRTAATTSPSRSRTCTGWTACGGSTWRAQRRRDRPVPGGRGQAERAPGAGVRHRAARPDRREPVLPARAVAGPGGLGRVHGRGAGGRRREPSAPGRRFPSGTRCSGGCPGWRRPSAPWSRPRRSSGTAGRRVVRRS